MKIYIFMTMLKELKSADDEELYNGTQTMQQECVEHCKMRPETALHKAVKRTRMDEMEGDKATELYNYFVIVLHADTGSAEDMSRPICPILFHTASKDDQTLHSKYPTGDQS
jgi:hypothetical protein